MDARNTVYDFLRLPLSQRRFIGQRYGIERESPTENDMEWSKRVIIAVASQNKQEEFAEIVAAAKTDNHA